MSFPSPPLANVNISVGVLVHTLSIVRWSGFFGFLRIYGRIFFIQKLIAAVAAHPPVAEPTLATTTAKATGTALVAPTEVALTNHAHARTHDETAQKISSFSDKLRDFKVRNAVHKWELSNRP